MLVLNAKCKGCSCVMLITESFCNVVRLDPKDYSYQCAGSMESECLNGEEMYTREPEMEVDPEADLFPDLECDLEIDDEMLSAGYIQQDLIDLHRQER